MLELFKPLLFLKDRNNPIIFDEFGEKYNESEQKYKDFNKNINRQIENNHPFIIFYNSDEKCYYYLKARGTTFFSEKKGINIKRKKFPNEIIVRESFDDGLFKKEVFVDCSQIFKCDENVLENIIDKEHYFYNNTKQLGSFDITNILDKLNECCNEIPPDLSIVEVKIDDNGNTYGKSIYLSDQKIEAFYDYLDNSRLYLNDYGENLVNSCVSSCNSEYKQCRDRYNNGIDFVKMFQKEYFNQEYQNTNYDKKYYQPFGINNSKSKDKER